MPLSPSKPFILACLPIVLALLNVEPRRCLAEIGQGGSIRYEVAFEGVGDKKIEQALRIRSDAERRKNDPPPVMGLLRHRAQRDVQEFQDVLKSMAYYGALIESLIDETSEPLLVTFRVNLGKRYAIRSLEVETPASFTRTSGIPAGDSLGLGVGTPAEAQRILDARDLLVQKTKNAGYPFAQAGEPRAVVDHRTESVAITFPLDPGHFARFGDTSISGLGAVEEEHIVRRIPWKKGEPYNDGLLSDFHKRLTETRLFSLVRVTHQDWLDDSGLLPIQVELTERKSRTLRAGVSYKTDEGFGATASWEHRNLFGRGERLLTSIIASQITFSGEGKFEKPDFLTDHQTLHSNLKIARDDTEAYESRNVEGSVLVRRKLWKGVKTSVGSGFRISEVDDAATGKDEFVLVHFPGQLEWDASNDLLDPSRGWRLKVEASPFLNTLDADSTFFRSTVAVSHYLTVMKKPFLVFASRAALGTILGADRDSVPADLRFYSGGGGSIRGYPYQSVSPLRSDDKPLGGTSIFECSAELRWKVSERIGLAAFLDGGGAFDSSLPDFSSPLRWGTGLGFRYYTPIGPLRVDVGFPINRREGIDDVVQFYISLGQAF